MARISVPRIEASGSSTRPSSDLRASGRRRTVMAAAALASVLIAPHGEVAADAGADLSLSASRGPVGTTLVLESPDVFGMDADLCPDPDPAPETPWGDEDAFEVRWELGLLPDGIVGTPVAEGSDFRYTTLGTEVVDVLDSGVVASEPGVEWSTTVTVPDGLAPGQRFMVNAECWRRGEGVPGGAAVWFHYYYLPVFTVTAADGSVPTTVPPSTAPGATTVPASPGTPSAAPAAPRAGSASFTG